MLGDATPFQGRGGFDAQSGRRRRETKRKKKARKQTAERTETSKKRRRTTGKKRRRRREERNAPPGGVKAVRTLSCAEPGQVGACTYAVKKTEQTVCCIVFLYCVLEPGNGKLYDELQPAQHYRDSLTQEGFGFETAGLARKIPRFRSGGICCAGGKLACNPGLLDRNAPNALPARPKMDVVLLEQLRASPRRDTRPLGVCSSR